MTDETIPLYEGKHYSLVLQRRMIHENPTYRFVLRHRETDAVLGEGEDFDRIKTLWRFVEAACEHVLTRRSNESH